jgi:CobQ/CobB/MinD/ParA nucleotide binding domain
VLVACWSTKGGTGTTTVAAALALICARSPGGALAVDLDGDLPAALGLPEGTPVPGVADWLAAAPCVPADGLARLEEPAGPGLSLVRRGHGPLAVPAAELLAGVLTAEPRTVVVDCGRIDLDTDDGGGVGRVLAAGAGRSLLVLRACYLALRRSQSVPLRPSGVVLVSEEGRSLTAEDVEHVTGVPVLAKVRVTEQVARAVDAGLLARELPRTLARDLRHAA